VSLKPSEESDSRRREWPAVLSVVDGSSKVRTTHSLFSTVEIFGDLKKQLGGTVSTQTPHESEFKRDGEMWMETINISNS
jgi:hypothetical protein